MTSARTATLDSQASSLLSFSGVIQTILVAAITGLSYGGSSNSPIKKMELYPVVLFIAGIGFILFMCTVVLALWALHERKFKPVPEPLGADVMGKSREQNDDLKVSYFQTYAANPSTFDLSLMVRQIVNAIGYQTETNTKKYDRISVAFYTLTGGLISTAVFGILLLILAR